MVGVIADGLAARDCQLVAVGLSRNAQTGAILPTGFVGKPDTEKGFCREFSTMPQSCLPRVGFHLLNMMLK